jgi:hypothetical protein
VHYHLTPVRTNWIRWGKLPNQIARYTRSGVTYHLAGGSFISSPETFAKAVERVLSTQRLPEPERVWTLRGSWE